MRTLNRKYFLTVRKMVKILRPPPLPAPPTLQLQVAGTAATPVHLQSAVTGAGQHCQWSHCHAGQCHTTDVVTPDPAHPATAAPEKAKLPVSPSGGDNCRRRGPERARVSVSALPLLELLTPPGPRHRLVTRGRCHCSLRSHRNLLFSPNCPPPSYVTFL